MSAQGSFELFWLFTFYILWPVEAIPKIRNTNWKTLTGHQAPVWEELYTYSGRGVRQTQTADLQTGR